MHKPTESEIREELSRGMSRLDYQRNTPRSPQFMEERQAAGNALKALLGGAGLDVTQVEQLQHQHRSRLTELTEEQRHDAVSKSPESRELLHAALNAKRGLIDSGTVRFPIDVKTGGGPIILDKPFLTQASAAVISGEQIAPHDSWVKTKFMKTRGGGDALSDDVLTFYYRWESPHDTSVNIDVTTALGFNGFAAVRASGPWYYTSETRLRVFAALNVRPWAQTDENGRPLAIPGELKDVARLNATSASVLDDSDSQPIVQTTELKSLSHSWVTIQPEELVIFEIAVVFHSVIEDEGFVSVDFDEGHSAILSPYVAIGVWLP